VCTSALQGTLFSESGADLRSAEPALAIADVVGLSNGRKRRNSSGAASASSGGPTPKRSPPSTAATTTTGGQGRVAPRRRRQGPQVPQAPSTPQRRRRRSPTPTHAYSPHASGSPFSYDDLYDSHGTPRRRGAAAVRMAELSGSEEDDDYAAEKAAAADDDSAGGGHAAHDLDSRGQGQESQEDGSSQDWEQREEFSPTAGGPELDSD